MIVVGDIGGAYIRIATYSDGVLGPVYRRATPACFHDGLMLLRELIDTTTHNAHIDRIVLGVRSFLEEDGVRMSFDDILPNWSGKPLAILLQEYFTVPVTLNTAVQLALQAEASHDVMYTYDRIAYHSIGAGVFGAYMRDGVVDTRAYGFGAYDETSHELTDALDALLGAYAVTETYGVAPQDLASDHVFWGQSAEYLAQGLYEVIIHWEPKIVVLGGAMILGVPAIPLTKTIAILRQYVPEKRMPLITPSRLGEHATLIGAGRFGENFA